MDENYSEWTDQDLADELHALDELIEFNQASLAATRKRINENINRREEVLDIIKQRAQRRGWSKNVRK